MLLRSINPYTEPVALLSPTETSASFTKGILLSFSVIDSGVLWAIKTLEAMFLDANPEIKFNFG